MRAVRFSRYGGPEVLDVVDVVMPTPGDGEVLVQVVAAALNPGEIAIREGVFASIWPATFPEGQGNDFSGYVAEVGRGVVGIAIGDEVLGFAPRAAHSEFVVSRADLLVPKPIGLGWDQAASIAGAGATAWATVQSVMPQAGETVVVSAAAGGVGSLAAQLARGRGARVIGTASRSNFDFLRALDIEPVEYGPGLRERLLALAPEGVDAFLDNFGAGAVDLALQLGVSEVRINSIADPRAAQIHGVRTDAQQQASSPAVWNALAKLVQTYSLDEIQDAYRDVATRHTSGKRVLRLRWPEHSSPLG
ncbi:MAG: NADPH:quinone reductase [Rhodoglobus sp.]|nr:NADPH:quinone reductase [Rhodoglobus sp.]